MLARVMRGIKRPHPGLVIVASVLTLAAIVAITMVRSVVDVGGLWDPGAHRQRSLDLVLFDGWVSPTVWYAPWTNTLGNLILFLPVGILTVLARDAFAPRALQAPSLRRGRSVVVAGLAGGLVSLGIEVTQYVLALGYTDVDDLLLNTLGAAAGGWLAVTLGKSSRVLAMWGIIVASLLIVGVMSAGIPDALAHAGVRPIAVYSG